MSRGNPNIRNEGKATRFTSENQLKNKGNSSCDLLINLYLWSNKYIVGASNRNEELVVKTFKAGVNLAFLLITTKHPLRRMLCCLSIFVSVVTL